VTSPAPVAVQFVGVSRHFGAVRAVDDVSFEVRDGEFFSMLGPSGSGKTTCLRLIAGFETPTAGRLLLHGVDVAGLPPYVRDVNTVFQDYALFPHMTVGDNVGYGLMIRRVGGVKRRERVSEALRMVRLDGYEKRRPNQLSGGQRQRVAIARALVTQPGIVLADEPTANLDSVTGQHILDLMKELNRTERTTFIFSTHDQRVMSHANAIVRLADGKLLEAGASNGLPPPTLQPGRAPA
jgi:putative spermidine/putrescine transport system ATP-binding protein